MSIVNIKADKMRYQANSIPYLLVMLSVVISIIATFQLINYDTFTLVVNSIRVVPDLRIGIEIAIGIVMMLSTFLAAEKVKFYDHFWSNIGLFILAGVNIFRIFNIPVYAFNQGWIPQKLVLITQAEFAAAALLLIAAGIITTRKIIILKHHMKELAKHG